MDMEYFRSTFRLVTGSEKALYQQLYDYFKRLIMTGILKEGDQMISEITICDELKVSRSTVRKAMDLLMEDGLIVRQRGRGTHVLSPQMKRPVNYLYNFTENIRQIGAKPSSQVLESNVIPGEEVPEKIREELKLNDNNNKVFRLHRIR